MNVGDRVIRMLAGTIPMELRVTALTDDRVICGAWTFDRKTGAEIDDELGWGPTHGVTGSFLLTPSEADVIITKLAAKLRGELQ